MLGRSPKRVRREAHEDALASDPATTASADPQLASSAATSSRPNGLVNTTGLFALPVEMFARIQDELLADTRQITHEDAMSYAMYTTDKFFRHRADVLRPLTQVCRLLRNMYLAEVYEHMETWIARGKSSGQWWKYNGDRLVVLSKSCAQGPEFAQHIRWVVHLVPALNVIPDWRRM